MKQASGQTPTRCFSSRWTVTSWTGIGLIVLIALAAAIIPAVRQSIWHLLAGWGYFLRRNLAAFSLDPDIAISGLVGGVCAVVFLHLLATWWGRVHGHAWKWSQSGILAIAVVILFAAAFIVPGIIFLLRLPFQQDWLRF